MGSGGLTPTPKLAKKAPSCWVVGGLGCLALLVLFFVVLGVAGYQGFHTKRGKEVVSAIKEVVQMSMKVPEAQKKIIDIHGALVRFQLKNNVFPKTLTELYPAYLPDKSELHCSLDHVSNTSHVSFAYKQPQTSAPSTSPLLSLTWTMSTDIDNDKSATVEILSETIGGRLILAQYQNGKLIETQSSSDGSSDTQ